MQQGRDLALLIFRPQGEWQEGPGTLSTFLLSPLATECYKPQTLLSEAVTGLRLGRRRLAFFFFFPERALVKLEEEKSKEMNTPVSVQQLPVGQRVTLTLTVDRA